MRKGKNLLRLTALLSALILTVSGAQGVSLYAATQTELENKIAQLEAKQKEIKSELSEAQSNLSEGKKKKDLIDSQIKTVQEQLDLMSEQISSLSTQMAQKQEEITAAEKEIGEKEASIEDTKKKLGERLRAVMKSGNVTPLQMLMNTDSYVDYLIKAKAVKQIAAEDQSMVDALEQALAEIRNRKTALEGEKSALQTKQDEIKALKATSDGKKAELNTLYAAAQTEVRKLQSTETRYNNELKANQAEIEKANAAIAELTRASSGGSYDGSLMFWPVPTVRALSSTYGYRWGKLHRGIDIANGPIPIYGENIVAAADGTVIASNYTSTYGTGWCYGYGYCCIVDHGQDAQGRSVCTLYAHCSAMYARVGQKVTGGKTVLGKAGSTGDVTGPHLHFEVRVGGTAVDPLYTYVNPKVN